MIHRLVFYVSLFAMSVLVAGLAVVPVAAADGATIRVSTSTDSIANDGVCSLREAVRSANLDKAIGGCAAGRGADTIVLAAGRHTLSIAGMNENAALTGDLDLTGRLTIRGSGASSSVIDAQGVDRVFHVQPGAFVTLNALRITGGWVVGDGLTAVQSSGGGISNHANLTITNSVIGPNWSGAAGAGIFNSGTVTIKDSILRKNAAGGGGGGLYSTGSAYLIRTRVEDNVGGGSHSPMALVDKSANSGPAGGYAAGITSEGFLSVSLSVVTRNFGNDEWGHGGISMERGTVSDTTISDNASEVCGTGGLVVVGGDLVRSTVTGNWNGNCGPAAGGVYAIDAQILNSTISGNWSTIEWVPAGIKSLRGSIVSSTITENVNSPDGQQYHGIAGLDADKTVIRNTILFGNRGDLGSPTYAPGGECRGLLVSAGHNMFRSTAGCTINSVKSDSVGVDPMLGPLANNGGPTFTHGLMVGSPAIDAWYDGSVGSGATCPALDQRGVHRPQDGNADHVAKCDIGALETIR